MRTLWRTAGVTFVLDQITKVVVLHLLGLIHRGVLDVMPPFLTFRMAWNQGINFGLLASDANTTRWILIAVALAISVWIAVWMHRERPGRWGQIAGGLLIGGALGNVLDRLIYGAVADFLNMSCCGIENPYSFNVADIAIILGAFGLILFTGKSKTA